MRDNKVNRIRRVKKVVISDQDGTRTSRERERESERETRPEKGRLLFKTNLQIL